MAFLAFLHVKLMKISLPGHGCNFFSLIKTKARKGKSLIG